MMSRRSFIKKVGKSSGREILTKRLDWLAHTVALRGILKPGFTLKTWIYP